MTFINEYISNEDFEKYNIQAIEDNFVLGNSSSNSWTVDKENNIFLKKIANSRIDDYGTTWVHWAYFFEGKLYVITTIIVDSNKAKRGEDYWVHKKIIGLNVWGRDGNLSNEQGEELLPFIEEAFVAYGKSGVYSSSGGFELKLEIDLN